MHDIAPRRRQAVGEDDRRPVPDLLAAQCDARALDLERDGFHLSGERDQPARHRRGSVEAEPVRVAMMAR